MADLKRSLINLNLEALRGYAALFVVINHLGDFHSAFNSTYYPSALLSLEPSGHLSVLIFFILSGYVISANHVERLSSTKIITYLKKRFLRIYPIYFISLILALLIAVNHYSLYQIICNFLMLHVVASPVFVENSPSWSINFEVLYYLIFIPISFFNIRPLLVFVMALILAFANYYYYPNVNTPIISSYLFGLCFWISGMCLARYFKLSDKQIDHNTFLSLMFLFIIANYLVERNDISKLVENAAVILFNSHLLYPAKTPIQKILLSYKDLVYLPYFFYIIMVFSNRIFKYQKLYFILINVSLLFSICYTTWQYVVLKNQPHFSIYMLYVFYYCISLFLLFTKSSFIEKVSKKIMEVGFWLGSISYAIYIIHMPILYVFGRLRFLNVSGVKYEVKFIMFFIVVIAISYVLEKKFQPWAKKSIFLRVNESHCL